MMGNGTCILYHVVSSVFRTSTEKIGTRGYILVLKGVSQHCGMGCYWQRRKRTRSSAFISQAPRVETWAVSVLQADLVAYVQILLDVMQMLQSLYVERPFLACSWPLQNIRLYQISCTTKGWTS